MAAKTITAPVTERALIQRINRVLAKKQELLKKCREASGSYNNLGDYYTIDVYRNAIIDTHLNLEKLGRKLDVLAKWESLAG